MDPQQASTRDTQPAAITKTEARELKILAISNSKKA
jgi:hypothetical protein